jgi:hypothetical protein
MLEWIFYICAPLIAFLHCFLMHNYMKRIETLEKILIDVMENNQTRDKLFFHLKREVEARSKSNERI